MTWEGLRERADAGDPSAADWLAEVLAGRGDVEGLRQRADAGDQAAASRLAELLAARGDVEGLRTELLRGHCQVVERDEGVAGCGVALIGVVSASRAKADDVVPDSEAGGHVSAVGIGAAPVASGPEVR